MRRRNVSRYEQKLRHLWKRSSKNCDLQFANCDRQLTLTDNLVPIAQQVPQRWARCRPPPPYVMFQNNRLYTNSVSVVVRQYPTIHTNYIISHCIQSSGMRHQPLLHAIHNIFVFVSVLPPIGIKCKMCCPLSDIHSTVVLEYAMWSFAREKIRSDPVVLVNINETSAVKCWTVRLLYHPLIINNLYSSQIVGDQSSKVQKTGMCTLYQI